MWENGRNDRNQRKTKLSKHDLMKKNMNTSFQSELQLQFQKSCDAL